VRYVPVPDGSKVKMEGTSTIHDWTVNSPTIDGLMDADKNFPESALKDPAAAKPNVQVSIPVSTLKSYADSMDAVMWDHMNMERYPRIEYRLVELKPSPRRAPPDRCSSTPWVRDGGGHHADDHHAGDD